MDQKNTKEKRVWKYWKLLFCLSLMLFIGCGEREEKKEGQGDPAPSFYYALKDSGRVETADEKEEIPGVKNIPGFTGTILGSMQDKEGKEYYYGSQDGKVYIYDVELAAGKTLEVAGFSPYAYRACMGDGGELYLCDLNGLWKMKDREGELLCDFLEQDYVLERVDSLKIVSEGMVEITALLDGERHSLQCIRTEGTKPEKMEITLALTGRDSGLEAAAAEFNREHGDYRIVFEMPQKGESYEDYRRRIQLEITSGRGPDLIANSVLLDYRDFVAKGYIEPIDDVITNAEDMIPACFQVGLVDQRSYGVPYQCYAILVAYAKDSLGDREYFSLRDLMEGMESFAGKVLEPGASGNNIVYHYALSDRKDKTYIDWEKGISHLTEAPFLELLDFAKKYASNGGQELPGERAFAVSRNVMNQADLNYLKAYFDNEEILLGYPGSNGGRNIVVSYLLFLNANSEKKTAAREFLNFVLSEGNQTKMAEYHIPVGALEVFGTPMLPVRWGALQAWLENENLPGMYQSNGIEFENTPLTEEQKESFIKAMEGADYAEFGTDEVQDIIYDALAPYFQGSQSAEEAAEILHRRIQLYLNENND